MKTAILTGLLITLLGGGFWLITDRLDSEYQKGYDAGEKAGRESWVDAKEKMASNLAAKEAEIRDTQARHAKEVAALTDRLHEEMTHGLNQKNQLIADLRGGNLRLRQRFKTCANTLSREPSGADGNNETRPPVLSPEDQEFLIRIGHEADDVARRLSGCQQYIQKIEDR